MIKPIITFEKMVSELFVVTASLVLSRQNFSFNQTWRYLEKDVDQELAFSRYSTGVRHKPQNTGCVVISMQNSNQYHLDQRWRCVNPVVDQHCFFVAQNSNQNQRWRIASQVVSQVFAISSEWTQCNSSFGSGWSQEKPCSVVRERFSNYSRIHTVGFRVICSLGCNFAVNSFSKVTEIFRSNNIRRLSSIFLKNDFAQEDLIGDLLLI